MSDWSRWSNKRDMKHSFSGFLSEGGQFMSGDPKEIAKQNGWMPDNFGWYRDGSGQVVARSVGGKMIAYDGNGNTNLPNQTDMGNPAVTAGQKPAERARSMGLQSNGKGGYTDESGQVVARTVNGELVFYDDNGGAVSDGAGGQALVQSQPSWVDPETGLIMVPPAQPESPIELAAVPDPVPATAPMGYDKFIKDRHKKMKEMAQQAPPEPEQPEMPEMGMEPPQMEGYLKFMGKKSQLEEDKLKRQLEYLDEFKEILEQEGGLDPQSLVKTAVQNAKQGQQLNLGRRPVAKAAMGAQMAQQQAPQQPVISQQRQTELKDRLGAMNSPSTLKSGAGANQLSLEDIGAFRKYIKEGPQNERDEINDDEMNFAMDHLKGVAGKKWNNFQSRLKGKGDPEPARKVVSRAREVVQSYLSNRGRSAIDNQLLPFSDSELDHGISLSNGGEDNGDNWRWLPKRFNQFKGDLDDDGLLEALDKEESRQNDPDFKIKQQEDELTNMSRDTWRDKFEQGYESLNIADIKQAKGKQGLQLLKSLAEKNGVSYYKDRGKVRDSGRAGGGTQLGVEELQNRLIDQLGIPDNVDIDNFNEGMFTALQKIEDARSELDSSKRTRRKEKRLNKNK